MNDSRHCNLLFDRSSLFDWWWGGRRRWLGLGFCFALGMIGDVACVFWRGCGWRCSCGENDRYVGGHDDKIGDNDSLVALLDQGLCNDRGQQSA